VSCMGQQGIDKEPCCVSCMGQQGIDEEPCCVSCMGQQGQRGGAGSAYWHHMAMVQLEAIVWVAVGGASQESW
jgi:hypothetical protein